MDKKPIVINLFAGPGAGKSTTAAGVFYEMKLKKFNVELVLEYAKDVTWEGGLKRLENQTFIFGNQYNRQKRCADQVDYIVTDSPLLLSSIYADGKTPIAFHDLVKYQYNEFENMNYFINRVKTYSSVGRKESEDEAIVIDQRIRNYLDKIEETYQVLDGDRTAVISIVKDVLDRKVE